MRAASCRPARPRGALPLGAAAPRGPPQRRDHLSTGAREEWARSATCRELVGRGTIPQSRPQARAREARGSPDRWRAVGSCPYVGCSVRPGFRWFFLFLLRFSNPNSGLAPVHAPRVWFSPSCLLHQLGPRSVVSE
jgi:hypothetical protein